MTSCDLESLSSLDDVFSHAAIASTLNKDGVAILAAYTHSRQLRVYKLAINWNIPPQPQTQPQQPKPIIQLNTPPNLIIKRLKIVDSAFPADSPHVSSRAMLTHLEVLGPLLSGSAPFPTVLCVFSGKSAERQPFTVVSRWDLKESPCALHPSFDQLGVRRASISSPGTSELDLHRLEDITLDRCVIGFMPIIQGTVIAFACSDGLFDFRDRTQLHPFSSNLMDGKITNMIQAGFSFTGGGPCIDLLLSPNNTVAVRLDQDYEVHLMVMDFTRDVNENLEVICVSLALQHAYSCSNYLNNDDLLLVARKYSKKPGNPLSNSS